MYIKSSSKKKILFTLGSFFPLQKGGPDNSVYWLTKEISENFNNIEITTSSFYEKKSKYLFEKNNIIPNKIIKLENLNVIYFSYIWIRLLSIPFIKFLIFDIKKYDLVVINSFLLKSNWIIALACNIHNVPYIISTRGELERGALDTGNKLKIFFIKPINKFFYKNLAGIISSSNREKKYNKFFLGNINNVIIPNFFKTKFLPILNNDIKRKNYIYLGRIHPKKNLELTIKAFSKFISTNNSKENLLIYGSGNSNYINSLKTIILKNSLQNNIKFMGPIYNEDKFKLLCKFKALILISKSENFGNVIMEALYCGTDVIISKNLPWPTKKYIHRVDPEITDISKALIYVSIKKNLNSIQSNSYIKKNFMNSDIINKYINMINKHAK